MKIMYCVRYKIVDRADKVKTDELFMFLEEQDANNKFEELKKGYTLGHKKYSIVFNGETTFCLDNAENGEELFLTLFQQVYDEENQFLCVL